MCAYTQGHLAGTQAMRPQLPHPAAQLGGTRPRNRPDLQQAASETAGFVAGNRTPVPNGSSAGPTGPAPRPAGPFGAKAGFGGFRPPFGAGPRPMPGPGPVQTEQPSAPVPPVSRAMGPPPVPPSRSVSMPQPPPAPGLAQGPQQQPTLQRGPAAMGPPRFGRPASAGTGAAAAPTLANGGVPPQSASAAHRLPGSRPVGASAQRHPPPPSFGAAPPAAQRHGPVQPLAPPSTGSGHRLSAIDVLIESLFHLSYLDHTGMLRDADLAIATQDRRPTHSSSRCSMLGPARASRRGLHRPPAAHASIQPRSRGPVQASPQTPVKTQRQLSQCCLKRGRLGSMPYRRRPPVVTCARPSELLVAGNCMSLL